MERMRVAFGLKAHSGWAALVALGLVRGGLEVTLRSRLELVREADAHWAKQPYHAAEGLDPEEARDVVARGIDSARSLALRELRAAKKRVEADGHELIACGLLAGDGMPEWSVDEILAVHFRMHKAEGELFRDVLARAASACSVRLVAIPEKRLAEHAVSALATPARQLDAQIAALGKSLGPPWGKDQKSAALAAWVALRSR
jgi:hypothetical protein